MQYQQGHRAVKHFAGSGTDVECLFQESAAAAHHTKQVGLIIFYEAIDAFIDVLFVEFIVEEYEHNHVMRDMFTICDGNVLTTPMLTVDEVIKSYSMTIPADWVVGNCHVVAFVNLGGASKEVLQAHEVKLSE